MATYRLEGIPVALLEHVEHLPETISCSCGYKRAAPRLGPWEVSTDADGQRSIRVHS